MIIATPESGSFITLHRKITQWEWYTDANVMRLFVHLLLIASHKDYQWRGIEIKRGQVMTGRKVLASETGMSEQEIRTALNKLKSTKEITIRATSKYSIITICNYSTYQDIKERKQPTNQPAEQPTINQQSTTYNNSNNVNKKNKSRGTASVPNPGFSDYFMSDVWPFFVKNKKGPYRSIETQGVAIRQLFEMSLGNEETAKHALRETLTNNYQGFTWYFDRKGGSNGHSATTAERKGVSPEDFKRGIDKIRNLPGLRRVEG